MTATRFETEGFKVMPASLIERGSMLALAFLIGFALAVGFAA